MTNLLVAMKLVLQVICVVIFGLAAMQSMYFFLRFTCILQRRWRGWAGAFNVWLRREPLNKRVYCALQKMQLHRIDGGVETFCFLYGLWITMYGASVFWANNVDEKQLLAGMGVAWAQNVAVSMYKLFPRCFRNNYYVAFLYVTQHLTALPELLFEDDYSTFLSLEVFHVLHRIAGVLVIGDFKLSCSMNAISCALWYVIYTLRFPTYVTVMGTLQYEMSIFAVIFGVSWIWSHSLKANVVASLDAKESRNLQSMGASLLALTCDAVVHLSSDLKISRHSPQLDTILFKEQSKQGRQEEMFTGHIHDDKGRSIFEQFINRSSRNPEALCMNLCDSMLNPVRVQVLHAAGLDIDDQPFHILGIREMDPSSHELPDADTSNAAINNLIATSNASSSSVESGSRSNVTEWEPDDDCWVTFSAQTYRILDFSPAYEKATHANKESGFTDALLSPSDFLLQLQTVYEDAQHDPDGCFDIVVNMSVFGPKDFDADAKRRRKNRRSPYSIAMTIEFSDVNWDEFTNVTATLTQAQRLPRCLDRVSVGTPSHMPPGMALNDSNELRVLSI